MTPEELRSRLVNLILAGVIANDGKGPAPTTGTSWLAEKAGVTVQSAHKWITGDTSITELRERQLCEILEEAEAQIEDD